MNLDDDQTQTARYVFAEFVRRRRLSGGRIPQAAIRLHEQLSMAVDGHEIDSDTAESKPEDLIDSKQAARVLGVSQRHIRRLHADLDATRCGRAWVFHRQAVLEYAEAKGDRENG